MGLVSEEPELVELLDELAVWKETGERLVRLLSKEVNEMCVSLIFLRIING